MLSTSLGFNQNHPELMEGKMFLANLVHTSKTDFNGEFNAVPWKSKRLGNKSFTWDGKPLEQCRPVFMQRSDFEEFYTKRPPRKHRR